MVWIQLVVDAMVDHAVKLTETPHALSSE